MPHASDVIARLRLEEQMLMRLEAEVKHAARMSFISDSQSSRLADPVGQIDPLPRLMPLTRMMQPPQTPHHHMPPPAMHNDRTGAMPRVAPTSRQQRREAANPMARPAPDPHLAAMTGPLSAIAKSRALRDQLGMRAQPPATGDKPRDALRVDVGLAINPTPSTPEAIVTVPPSRVNSGLPDMNKEEEDAVSLLLGLSPRPSQSTGTLPAPDFNLKIPPLPMSRNASDLPLVGSPLSLAPLRFSRDPSLLGNEALPSPSVNSSLPLEPPSRPLPTDLGSLPFTRDLSRMAPAAAPEVPLGSRPQLKGVPMQKDLSTISIGGVMQMLE